MILRKTYVIEIWSQWDACIHKSAHDFRQRFGHFPNILLASSATYRQIDFCASRPSKRKNIEGPDGESLPEDKEEVGISGFSGEDYSLKFCIDEKVSPDFFSLIFDDEPDDGEPPPEHDTDLEVEA